MTEANTREAPTDFDALIKIREGEPYYALLGRDEFAPSLMLDHAHMTRNRARARLAAGEITEADWEQEMRQATNSEKMAWQFDDYRKGAAPAEAQPVEEKPTYSGHVLPEETVRRDREHSAKVACVRSLHNSIAELTAQAEIFAEIGSIVPAAQMVGTIQQMRLLAERLEPREIMKK